MWKNIIGQKKIINLLKQVYTSGKIPHSYIFAGQEGCGKDAVAIEFSKLINCEKPSVDEGSCDLCLSCRSINSLESSSFKFITALPTKFQEKENEDGTGDFRQKKDKSLDAIREEFKKKSLDYYYKLNIPDANDIRIESIRRILDKVYLTPEKGKKKIFLISRCDLMNIQSANAFLKVLEDPPGDTLFILTTSRLNSLLPTITGRCQIIKFQNIEPEDIRQYMIKAKKDISFEDIELFVRLSGGSITRCNEILNSYYLELRDAVIDIFRNLLASKQINMARQIENIIRDKDREKLRQALQIMIIWFRDIMLTKSGYNEGIMNPDIKEVFNKFSVRYNADTYRIINLIEDAIKDTDNNINPELILYNLLYNIISLIKPYK